MLEKMLNNKKIVIISIAIAILILVLVLLLVKCGQDESKGIESGSDTGVKQEETYVGDGLEVEKDDEEAENSVDSSGYWDDAEDGKTNTDSTNAKQDDITTNQPDNETENNAGNETEEPEYENDVTDEDTLDDGTSWGDIY